MAMADEARRGGRKPGQFLDGDPLWWASPITRAQRKDAESLPSLRQQKQALGDEKRGSLDVQPPRGWQGWKRQRQRPMLVWLLLPLSWSLFLLPLSLLFLIFDADKELSPWWGAALSLAAPSFVVLTLLLLTHQRISGNPLRVLARSFTEYWNVAVTSLLLLTIWWSYDGRLDPADPFWFAFFLLSAMSWIWWATRAAQGIAARSGCWLLPVKREVFIPRKALEEVGWHWCVAHDRWAPTLLGRLQVGVAGWLHLSGMLENGRSFLRLEFVAKNGLVIDPWTSDEQILPMQGLASFFSMDIDLSAARQAMMSIDISSLSELRCGWPEWCRPEAIGASEEE